MGEGFTISTSIDGSCGHPGKPGGAAFSGEHLASLKRGPGEPHTFDEYNSLEEGCKSIVERMDKLLLRIWIS